MSGHLTKDPLADDSKEQWMTWFKVAMLVVDLDGPDTYRSCIGRYAK